MMEYADGKEAIRNALAFPDDWENKTDEEIDEADAEPNDCDADEGFDVPDSDNDCSSELEDPRILKDDDDDDVCDSICQCDVCRRD